MNIAQIIIYIIIGIVFIISYFGAALAKKETSKIGFIVLWIFTSALTYVIAIIMTVNYWNLYDKQKCPQYEKVQQDLYILKK